MNFRKLIVPTLCVLLGCAGGAAMGSVTAQAWPQPANVQRWQQECVLSAGQPGSRRRAENANRVVRGRGEQGWELVAITSTDDLCFKRPAP